MDSALLVLRVVVGLYLAAHGAQKLFGWWGGPGYATTVQMMGSHLGYRPAWFWTAGLVAAELIGGLLMALGLLGPIGPLAVASTMVGATFSAHWGKGAFGQNGGFEMTLTNLAVAIAVAVAGSGAYSLDTVLGLSVPTVVAEVFAVLVFAGVLLSLATRRVPQPQTQAQAA